MKQLVERLSQLDAQISVRWQEFESGLNELRPGTRLVASVQDGDGQRFTIAYEKFAGTWRLTRCDSAGQIVPLSGWSRDFRRWLLPLFPDVHAQWERAISARIEAAERALNGGE